MWTVWLPCHISVYLCQCDYNQYQLKLYMFEIHVRIFIQTCTVHAQNVCYFCDWYFHPILIRLHMFASNLYCELLKIKYTSPIAIPHSIDAISKCIRSKWNINWKILLDISKSFDYIPTEKRLPYENSLLIFEQMLKIYLIQLMQSFKTITKYFKLTNKNKDFWVLLITTAFSSQHRNNFFFAMVYTW